MLDKVAFAGLIVTPTSSEVLSIFDGFICVEHGKITRVGNAAEFGNLKKSEALSDFEIIHLNKDQFLIPGFVDCHTHAPQFPNIGLGLDRPLLEWLDKYTFPLELQYSNVDFAAKVYDQVVQRLINNGTTTACYFGTLHLEGTLELAKSVVRYHQRALVGKVSMNMKNDAGYYNNTDKELADTRRFVEKVLSLKNDLVLPVITPRFAVSCDEKLMTGLSEISRKYQCRIQSHISENQKEIEHVLDINPGCTSYSQVYDKSNILNDKCIMAHAVYLSEEEMKLLAARGVSIAHCPSSNTRLRSGLCPVKKLINNKLTVGLGTDVSGGESASMLDAIRRTMDVSTHLELLGNENYSIDWKEAVYLATLGGAKALNLDDKIGNFEVGKEFDALLIRTYTPDGPIDKYETSIDEDYGVNLVQRFVHLGDDRNIQQVYVKGKSIKNNNLS